MSIKRAEDHNLCDVVKSSESPAKSTINNHDLSKYPTVYLRAYLTSKMGDTYVLYQPVSPILYYCIYAMLMFLGASVCCCVVSARPLISDRCSPLSPAEEHQLVLHTASVNISQSEYRVTLSPS